MTTGKCNYCKKDINIKTYSNDKGKYYCSVVCFEKFLQEKARRKKYILTYAMMLALIASFSLIFINFAGNLGQQRGNEGLQAVQGEEITLAGNNSKAPIPVTGDAQFTSIVNNALNLLKKYNYPQYNLLVQLGCSIQLSEKSQGNLVANINKNKILIFNTLTRDTKRYIPEQLAGIIVHQATHILELNQGDPGLKPEAYEKMALENEIATYKLVGAPEWMLKEALERQNTPAFYIVEAGDNPWLIAQKVYGDGNKAQLILDANKNAISSGQLVIGQQLVIPRGIEQN